MRIARSTQLASSCISLFIQYALVISITVSPLSSTALAQQKVLPSGRPKTTGHNEVAPELWSNRFGGRETYRRELSGRDTREGAQTREPTEPCRKRHGLAPHTPCSS